jgi:hypothetical protein
MAEVIFIESSKKCCVFTGAVIDGVSEVGAIHVVVKRAGWNLNCHNYKKPNCHIVVKNDTAEEFTTALRRQCT